ncbi:MAG: NADH-quinone oxidoreductase subunit NuoB [Oligoflexia bacterium]|nr:NADH-quinone oxidoreductase subunit NuoB [Oligoflexia bacterium]
MSFLASRLETLVFNIEKTLHVPLVLSEGCCTVEIENTSLASYDWGRLGVSEVEELPQEANLLIVAGWVNKKRSEEIKEYYEQMRKPTQVIAVGSCALSCSPYKLGAGSEMIKVNDLINVDIFVPGCPPRPEAILSAIIELQKKLSPGPSAQEVLHAALK